MSAALSELHRIFHGFSTGLQDPHGHPFVSSRQARGVTGHGSARGALRIVGNRLRDRSNFVHGFVWSEADGFVTLDFPGSSTGTASVLHPGGERKVIAHDVWRAPVKT